jgi:hypothetical protein
MSIEPTTTNPTKKAPRPHICRVDEAIRKANLFMDNSVSSRKLEVKFAGAATEYGTLTLLMESCFQQPVLVMPLERTIMYGSVTLFQWMIHVTTRITENSPIAYATFRAAEVKQTVLGSTLVFPPLEEGWIQPKERAQHLQQQFQECVADLLKRSAHVTQVIVPARHRLPDEWVWSARCTDEHIAFRDGSWILLDR